MIRTKNLIATSVKDVMQENFPDKHLALCHAYAIVGANLAAIEFEKSFRPVGGKAVFDTGTTQLIYMTDKQAFANPLGARTTVGSSRKRWTRTNANWSI